MRNKGGRRAPTEPGFSGDHLRQLQNLDREIQRDWERLQRLDAQARRATRVRPEELAGRELAIVEAADLREKIEAGIERRMALRARLVAYIDGIPDSVTRDIFKLKYLDGQTWRQIAAEMHLSTDACKKRHGKQLKQKG